MVPLLAGTAPGRILPYAAAYGANRAERPEQALIATARLEGMSFRDSWRPVSAARFQCAQPFQNADSEELRPGDVSRREPLLGAPGAGQEEKRTWVA